jgi:hypothetical protein
MSCPDLETLSLRAAEGDEAALAHLEGCEACAQLMESHRDLERELRHLSDPFPPSAFVGQVMARIEAAPTPVRVELKTGFLILLASLAMGIGALLAAPHAPAELATNTASAFLTWREIFFGISSAAGTLWRVAAIPMIAVVSALFLASLVGLRRFGSAGFTDVKVS